MYNVYQSGVSHTIDDAGVAVFIANSNVDTLFWYALTYIDVRTHMWNYYSTRCVELLAK